MGGHKTISCSDVKYIIPPPPPPLPDYSVWGEMSPICIGDYYYRGELNGYPYYQRDEDAWYLYHGVPPKHWFICNFLGRELPPYYMKPIADILGTYTHGTGWSGWAIVKVYEP